MSTVKFESGSLSPAAKLSSPLTEALSETVASLSLGDGEFMNADDLWNTTYLRILSANVILIACDVSLASLALVETTQYPNRASINL